MVIDYFFFFKWDILKDTHLICEKRYTQNKKKALYFTAKGLLHDFYDISKLCNRWIQIWNSKMFNLPHYFLNFVREKIIPSKIIVNSYTCTYNILRQIYFHCKVRSYKIFIIWYRYSLTYSIPTILFHINNNYWLSYLW